ncbi:MAG: hypothetical protein IJ244_05285 [Bacteroidaceae bacterium]|nr:hypothetical protein [Bacteroidaceae bacterium]
MHPFLIYIIQVNLILTVLCAAYQLIAENRQFTFRRMGLWLCAVASFTAPLLAHAFRFHMASASQHGVAVTVNEIQEVFSDVATVWTDPTASSVSLPWADVIFAVYLTGVVLMLLFMFYGFLQVLQLMRSSRATEKNGHHIRLLQGEGPTFSIGRNIFMYESDFNNNMLCPILFTHEWAHIRQHHTIDILAFSLVRCLCWFNPISWILFAQLKYVHELLADRAVVGEFHNASHYSLLLSQSYPLPPLSFYNGFGCMVLKRAFRVNHPGRRRLPAMAVFLFIVTLVMGLTSSRLILEHPVSVAPKPNEAIVYVEGLPARSVQMGKRNISSGLAQLSTAVYTCTHNYHAQAILSLTYRRMNMVVDAIALSSEPQDEFWQSHIEIQENDLKQTCYDPLEQAFIGELAGNFVLENVDGRKTKEPFRVRFKMPV